RCASCDGGALRASVVGRAAPARGSSRQPSRFWAEPSRTTFQHRVHRRRSDRGSRATSGLELLLLFGSRAPGMAVPPPIGASAILGPQTRIMYSSSDRITG